MKDFTGKVAVITGGGRGIGRGIALRCAKEGMKVVLAGYGMESITQTAADLEAMGTETLVVQTDVSSADAVNNLADKSFEAFGEVHLLVNNAGVGVATPVLKSTLDDWNWVMGVNFYGVLYGMQAFIPRMLEQGQGHVVNVSSVAGVLPADSSYGVSKHAVVALSEAYYHNLRDTPVRVSAYCPGWVVTDIDTANRSRPERFGDTDDDAYRTDEWNNKVRASLDGGYSIERSADILFEGLMEDKLYIGVSAFTEQLPDLPDRIQGRTDRIINEENPSPSNDD